MSTSTQEKPSSSQIEPNPWDNAKPQDYKELFKHRSYNSEFMDPCSAAHKASMDCLDRHDYDRDQCLDFFKAYRECKAAWLEQRRADRRAGRT